MTEELKACLCGEKARIVPVEYSAENFQFYVECPGCGLSSAEYETKAAAIRMWNTRPIEDALTAENKKLHDLCKELIVDSDWWFTIEGEASPHQRIVMTIENCCLMHGRHPNE